MPIALAAQPPLIAGLLVANIAALAAFGVLYYLVLDATTDAALARRTVLYTAIFPLAFYYAVPYTESLFLLLSVTACLAVQRRQWGYAGGCMALAGATRLAGMLLLPPLALNIMLQWKCGAVIQWRKALAGLFIAPLGLVSFMVYLWYHVGDPLAFVHAQQFWMRETVAPWTALERSFYAMLHPPSPVTDQYLRNVFNLHVVGSFITILLAARRMLRLSEGLLQ